MLLWTSAVLHNVQVMGLNGVSHMVVSDDLEGVTAVLKWLSMMPPDIGSLPADLPTSDPVQRLIGYCPRPSEQQHADAAMMFVTCLGACRCAAQQFIWVRHTGLIHMPRL